MANKIQKIKVVNYKTISEQELDLNGSNILITGKNNSGKSSITRDLIRRFQGIKPSNPVKNGEKKGYQEMTLSDGSKVVWKFTEGGTEKFEYTTTEKLTMTKSVLTQIGDKYFGCNFDINKFISSSNQEKTKIVEKLIGIDFSELDKKHKEAYDNRTVLKRELKRLDSKQLTEPDVVEKTNIENLKCKKKLIVDTNKTIELKYNEDNEDFQKEVINFNNTQDKITSKLNDLKHFKSSVQTFLENPLLKDFIDEESLDTLISIVESNIEPKKILKNLPEPKYKDVNSIDLDIEKAYESNQKYTMYESKLEEYNQWVKEHSCISEKISATNKELQEIKEEKTESIKKSKLPKEFEFTDEGLLYNGFQINDSTLSTSALYICALKLGSLGLGDIKAMHFEASSLDKDNLNEIYEFAKDNDLQLLIERASFDGKEMTYEITD